MRTVRLRKGTFDQFEAHLSESHEAWPQVLAIPVMVTAKALGEQIEQRVTHLYWFDGVEGAGAVYAAGPVEFGEPDLQHEVPLSLVAP